MLKIFLIILVIKNVFGDDESFEKYIDLLPEQEKQEFLNRIARRILEDIQTDNVPNQSQVEITDDQLEAHDAYVQDILKEETERLKDNDRMGGSGKVKEPGEDNNDEDRHIDLTLRDGKRLKRKNDNQELHLETTSELAFNVIPVETVYDNVNYEPNETKKEELKDLNKNSSNYYNNLRIKHETKVSSNEVRNESNSSHQSLKDDLISNTSNIAKNDNQKSSHKIKQDVKLTDNNTDFNTKKIQKEDYLVKNDTTTLSSENIKTSDKVIEITKLSGNEKHNLDEQVRKNTSTTIVSNPTTVSTEKALSMETEMNTNEFETTTLTVNERTTQDNPQTIKQHTYRKGGLDLNKNVSIVDTIVTDINTPTTVISFQSTSTPIDTATPTDIVHVTNSDNSTKLIETTDDGVKLQDTNSSLNVTAVRKSEDVESVHKPNTEEIMSNEIILEPMIDFRLGSDDVEELEDVDISSLKKTNKKSELGKEYEVYEVAAENPPFRLLNDVPINEPPYYVPIYDYAPENAYFRPYDRFGPNFENLDNDNIVRKVNLNTGNNNRFNYPNIPNKRSRFLGYNKKDYRQFHMKDMNYPINKGNPKTYGFMKPVKFINQNNHYNPYDYFDMDYDNKNNGRYILREAKYVPNYKPFPDSDESDHPFNKIHKSETVKDHIRAVRRLLYLQKIFGYVPDINKQVRKFDQYAKTTAYPIKKLDERLLNDPMYDNVVDDYYYGRVNSNEYTENVIRGNASETEISDSVPLKEVTGNFYAVLNNNKIQNNLSLKDTEDLNKVDDIITDNNKFRLFFDTMLRVLGDIIRFDDEALENYDWLRTSVDIRSAVTKLLHLAESLKYGEYIHPKDLELLKYILYQFKSSKNILEDNQLINIVGNVRGRKQKKGVLPKSNRNRYKIKQPLKQWKDFAKYIRNVKYVNGEQKLSLLYDFEDFLQKILYHLNEFHNAIKHIAMVTKYRDQKWFQDLKHIFFKNATRKQLGQVLLHISMVNFLERLEDDAINGSEVNFMKFIENNREAVRITKNDFVFVLRVLEELNRMND